MKKGHPEIKIKIISGLFLAVFISFWIYSNSFFHTHYLDGKKVVHSHPYSTNESHSHSGSDYLKVSSLNNLTLLFTAPLTFSFITFSIKNPLSTLFKNFIKQNYNQGYKLLRAPPVY